MDDDNISQVSWSAASESDRMLFTVLSNTERLDVERLPRLNGASSPRVEELPTVMEEEERSSQNNNEDMTADAIVREMEMNPPSRSFRTEDYTPIVDTGHDRSHDHHSETAIPPTRFEHHTTTLGRDNEETFDRERQHEESRHERRDESYGGHDESRTHEANPYDENRRHETEERRSEEEQHDLPTQETSRRGPEYEREQMLEKQSTLYDLNQLEARGVRLSRKWSMDDSLDDMTHELRHHLLVLDERENVGMMKNGLKMALTGIEIINTRFNLLDLEGWSTQAASELDRQDGNLSRIYRKYWRRSTSNNPESEIIFSLFSSMGMYHMKRSMARQMMNRNTRPSSDRRRRARPMDDDSSDDEMPPN